MAGVCNYGRSNRTLLINCDCNNMAIKLIQIYHLVIGTKQFAAQIDGTAELSEHKHWYTPRTIMNVTMGHF